MVTGWWLSQGDADSALDRLWDKGDKAWPGNNVVLACHVTGIVASLI